MDQALADLIVSNLSSDLLKPENVGHPNPLYGHCYVASETYFHLKGGTTDLTLVVMRIKHEGTTHWYLRKITGWDTNMRPILEYIDLTAGQFETPVPYEQGTATGFLTKAPSKRAQTLIERIAA